MRAHALVFAGRVRSPGVAFSLFLPRVFNRVPLWRGGPQKAMKTGCGEEMANLSLVGSRFFKGAESHGSTKRLLPPKRFAAGTVLCSCPQYLDASRRSSGTDAASQLL